MSARKLCSFILFSLVVVVLFCVARSQLAKHVEDAIRAEQTMMR